jgi:hypothetical protein
VPRRISVIRFLGGYSAPTGPYLVPGNSSVSYFDPTLVSPDPSSSPSFVLFANEPILSFHAVGGTSRAVTTRKEVSTASAVLSRLSSAARLSSSFRRHERRRVFGYRSPGLEPGWYKCVDSYPPHQRDWSDFFSVILDANCC